MNTREKRRHMAQVKQVNDQLEHEMRALKIARAHALEYNMCVEEPHGCGQQVVPLIILDAANLCVLMESSLPAEGSMIEAMAFRDKESLTEYQDTAMCQQCQDKFFFKLAEEAAINVGPTDGLVEMSAEEVRTDAG